MLSVTLELQTLIKEPHTNKTTLSIITNVLHPESRLLLTAALQGKYYSYPFQSIIIIITPISQIRHEKTMPREGGVTCPQSHRLEVHGMQACSA